MTPKMPRGAIPTPRSELAASEPYRPEDGAKIFVPSGQFPSPSHELAAARPYRPATAAPESFLAWPIEISLWGSDTAGDSIWAEEAFAKACAEPKVFLPAEAVRLASQQCGSSNLAEFLETRGFQIEDKAYLDGPFHSLDWTSEAALHSAITHAGPVKIAIAPANLQSRLSPGQSGWAVCGLPPAQPQNHCASLCGYGPLAALIDLFTRQGVHPDPPVDMPSGLCYAIFLRGSIGILDRQSLLNITGEAWVRTPTTIVRNLHK